MSIQYTEQMGFAMTSNNVDLAVLAKLFDLIDFPKVEIQLNSLYSYW